MPALSTVAPHPAAGMLTPDLAAWVESGLAVTMGVRDPEGWPISAYCLAVRVCPGGRLRVLFRRAGQESLLLALMRDPRVATTVTEPRTHRSVQLKGEDAVLSAPSDDDLRAARDQTRAFEGQLLDLGYAAAFAATISDFAAPDLVAVEFTPAALFSQTPGPGAGRTLAP